MTALLIHSLTPISPMRGTSQDVPDIPPSLPLSSCMYEFLNRRYKIVCEFATFKTLETQSILQRSHAQPQPILILKKDLNSLRSGDVVPISEAFGGPWFTHNPTRKPHNASKKKMVHF